MQLALRSLNHGSIRPPLPTFRGLSHELGAGATGGMVVQAKMTVGAAGDQYEREADRVAAQVVRHINAPQSTPQGAPIQCQKTEEEEKTLRMKPMLQAPSRGIPAGQELEAEIGRSRSGGHFLDKNVRKPMEQAFGADFSRVKVHTDEQSDQLNQSIQAKAFTTGQDIFFRRGAYNPGSITGQELLAHELTHVVQQNSMDLQGQTHQDSPAETQPVDVSRQSDSKLSSNSIIQRKVGFEIEMLALVDVEGRPIPEKTQIGTYGAHLTLDVDQGPAVDAPTPAHRTQGNYDLPIGEQARINLGGTPESRPAPNHLLLLNWQNNTTAVEFNRPPQNNTTGLDNTAIRTLDRLIKDYNYAWENWETGNAITALHYISIAIDTWFTANRDKPNKILHPHRRARHRAVRQVLNQVRVEAQNHKTFWQTNPALPGTAFREFSDQGAWGQHHPLGPGLGGDRYASILEIVTKAYEPETIAGRANILAAMTEAVALATAIEAQTHAFRDRVPLNTTGANVAFNIFVGNEQQPAQTTDGSIQTTFAIDLAQLASYVKSTIGFGSQGIYSLKHHSDTYTAHYQPIDRVRQQVSQTPGDATAILNAVGRPLVGGPSLVNLRGLLVLICQYLRMGKYFFYPGTTALDKNLVPLLSRTDLARIYQHNVPGLATTAGTEKNWVSTNLLALQGAILAQTGRTDTSMLFTDSTEVQSAAANGAPYDVSCEDFIDNIFTQATDGITAHFGGFKQLAAESIDPTGVRDATDSRRVGATHREGPVFELRNMIPTNAERFPHTSWIALATYTVNLLAALNARTEAQAVRDTRYRPLTNTLQNETADW
jgi:hypothetical protein